MKINPNIRIAVQDFIDYEKDLFDEDQLVYFFQSLSESGIAWILGSHYAAITAAFITEGVITGEIPDDIDIPDLEDT